MGSANAKRINEMYSDLVEIINEQLYGDGTPESLKFDIIKFKKDQFLGHDDCYHFYLYENGETDPCAGWGFDNKNNVETRNVIVHLLTIMKQNGIERHNIHKEDRARVNLDGYYKDLLIVCQQL